MSASYRVGMIVPSSNTTMEIELPEMCRRISRATGVDFSFHSSRAALHQVDADSLERMVEQADRCLSELADARVDAIVYACLVAVMARGPRAHEEVERQFVERIEGIGGYEPSVTSSAGAVVRSIQALGLNRVAIMTPYAPELTKRVVAYIEDYGIEVVDSLSRTVTDNVEVGRLDPGELPDLVARLDLSRAEGLIVSACVQMQSLPSIPETEARFGLPVLSAATATTWELLAGLELPTSVPDAGALLTGTRVEAATTLD